jgi:predicted nucleotide-binding protein (sugar kinase/HSP70/actin superfamily)
MDHLSRFNKVKGRVSNLEIYDSIKTQIMHILDTVYDEDIPKEELYKKKLKYYMQYKYSKKSVIFQALIIQPNMFTI